MRRTALTLELVLALAARADLVSPTPPSVPEGIADARGQLGFLRARDAGIAAIDLSTGEVRWSSSEGEWPLHADSSTVAVAAIDPRNTGALRIRFLRLTDGRRLVESQPITLPDGLRIPDPRKIPGRTTPAFTARAWVPPFTRGPSEGDGRLRVRWEWSYTPTYGYRRPSREETQRASGVVLIDATSGAVARGPDDERQGVPRAELPSTFRPDPQLLYWSFSTSRTSPPLR